MTPDEIRSDMLRTKLMKTIRNVSAWWGVSPDQAAMALGALRNELERDHRIGAEAWPDPRHARYNPGTPDAELREMAYEAALAIAGQGLRPSQRNVWAWCKSRGARKRETMALKIVGSVVAALSAREVASTYVRQGERAIDGSHNGEI